MLIKRSVLLAKKESTYNNDPAPVAATDAIQVENLSWAFTGQKMTPQQDVNPSLGKLKDIYGGTLIDVTFDMLVKGSGAAGTAPEIGVPFQASSMLETIDPGVDVTYTTASSLLASCTLYYYEDGKLFIITGCRGTQASSLVAGEPGKVSFALTGHFVSETDVSLVSPTLDATVPPVVLNAGFVIGGYAAVISALNWDLGVSIETPSSINSSDGYGEVTITGRDTTGTIDPEAVLKATNNFIDDWQTNTAMAMSTSNIGGTAGNIYDVSFAEVSYTDVAGGDRGGIKTNELAWKSARGTGEQDITWVFT